MHIESVSDDKIKVTINQSEQKKFGVTYESLSYSNANTRKLCEKIIANAKRNFGFTLDGAKLLIEAKQTAEGSIVIYLSKIATERDDEEYLCQTVCFHDADALLEGCEIFRPHMDKLAQSTLYEYENDYYLYFELFSTYSEARRILFDLFEYAEHCNMNKTMLDEYGRTIKGGKALEYLLFPSLYKASRPGE